MVAPGYFDPIEVNQWKFGEGGYGCNNPAAEAYFEARALHNESHSAIALLVSFGTGVEDFSRFTDQEGFTSRLRQYVNAGKVLASDKHRISRNLRTITDGIEKSYYRFNAAGDLAHIKLDQWKVRSTTEEIRTLTQKYLATKRVQTWLDEVAQVLVENRRKRVKLDSWRWEEALLGTRWVCLVDGCEDCQKEKVLRRRKEFEEHLRKEHPEKESSFPDLILRGKTTPPRDELPMDMFRTNG